MAFNKRKPGRSAKIGPREAMAIREDYATGQYSQPQLAVKYGIGPAQVGKIIRGEAWIGVTHGEAVVTQQEIQMREVGMLTHASAHASDPTNFIEREAQRSLERLKAIAPDLFDKAEKEKEKEVNDHNQAVVNRSRSSEINDRLAAYAKMMADAEMQADHQDGTTVRREQVVAQTNKSLVDRPQPKGKIASIDAEQLLETLKDENQS